MMTPEERAAKVLLDPMGALVPERSFDFIAERIAAAIRAAVKDATLETLTDMLDALRMAQEDTCSLHCPSVKKTGKEWAHSERCKTISEVIAKAEADIQVI